MEVLLFFSLLIGLFISGIWLLYRFFDAIFYRIEKHYGIGRWASASEYDELDDYDYSVFGAACFIFAVYVFIYF